MSDYGFFIWPAYGITATILLVILVSSICQLRRLQRELSQLEIRQR
ncbi:MAG: heme exporter protein CcmD [Rhodospirillaceae bacterium]|nr:heme exporter protein CcmD [Rhodospirillaceae bacterium]